VYISYNFDTAAPGRRNLSRAQLLGNLLDEMLATSNKVSVVRADNMMDFYVLSDDDSTASWRVQYTTT